MNTIKVVVNGWENPRRIITEPEKVLFEVGLDHNHCKICASRHNQVRQVLSRKGIELVHYTDDNGRVFVVLPAPFKEDVRAYVSRTLDLSIR